MSQMISIKKSKNSKLSRLKFLPRVGITVDFLGRELNYKYAPVLETLLNTLKRKASLEELMKVSFEQMKEITFHDAEADVKKAKKKVKKIKSRAKAAKTKTSKA